MPARTLADEVEEEAAPPVEPAAEAEDQGPKTLYDRWVALKEATGGTAPDEPVDDPADGAVAEAEVAERRPGRRGRGAPRPLGGFVARRASLSRPASANRPRPRLPKPRLPKPRLPTSRVAEAEVAEVEVAEEPVAEDDFDEEFDEDFAADEDEDAAVALVDDSPEPEADAEPEDEPEPDLVATGKHTPYHSKRGSGVLPIVAILAAMACAAVVGRYALQGTLRDDIGLSVTLSVLTAGLLMYALRAIANVRTVHLDSHGVLKVVFGDFSSTFDVTSPNTQIEQIGTPGKSGWKLVILRRSMSPVEIDAKTVDPRTFVEALRQWRPDL